MKLDLSSEAAAFEDGASPARILIVDDLQANRTLLRDLVQSLGHLPHEAENGLSALARIEQELPDLILLDLMMPEMDGFETLARIKSDRERRHVPVIMISGVDEINSVARCIEHGADDYIVKPFSSVILRARIAASLANKRFRDRENGYKRQIEIYNLKLEQRIAEQVKKITSSQMATIFALSKLAESRDPETGEHLERVREYCRTLANAIARTPKHSSRIERHYIDDLYAASPLHDIGKVGIPDRILRKPGKLTDGEFDIMKTHASIGAQTLRNVHGEFPGNDFIQVGIEIAESHHEKWNGSGYPHGIAREEIPLSGRIVALADVYDALTSKRCYKEPFSHEKSKAIIKENCGEHFDPDIVTAFLKEEDSFIGIRQKYRDSEKVLIA